MAYRSCQMMQNLRRKVGPLAWDIRSASELVFSRAIHSQSSPLSEHGEHNEVARMVQKAESFNKMMSFDSFYDTTVEKVQLVCVCFWVYHLHLTCTGSHTFTSPFSLEQYASQPMEVLSLQQVRAKRTACMLFRQQLAFCNPVYAAILETIIGALYPAECGLSNQLYQLAHFCFLLLKGKPPAVPPPTVRQLEQYSTSQPPITTLTNKQAGKRTSCSSATTVPFP